MIGDRYCFNSLLEGYQRLVLRYNVLQELNKREDSRRELLRLYQSINLYDLRKNNRISTIRLTFLEMTLAQEEILSKLSKDKCRALIIECFHKAKQIRKEFKGHFSTGKTIDLAIKCFYYSDAAFTQMVNSSEALLTYMNTGRLNLGAVSDHTLGKIVAYIQANYLQDDLQ